MASYPDRLKANLDTAIDSVVAHRENFVQNPEKDFVRNRKLSMRDTLKLILSMSGGSLEKELFTANKDVKPSAFVQSRKKIKPMAFYSIFRRFNKQCHNGKTFKGYRLYAVDGTCINMTRNSTAPSFVCNSGTPDGYNQLHGNALFDLENRVYADLYWQFQPHADEIGAAIKMLEQNFFARKSILIFDRGYESYNLFAHCLERDNVEFLCRVKQNKSAMREISKLPMKSLDCDIHFTITTSQTSEDKERGYVLIQVPKKRKSGKKYSRWDFPSPYPMHLRVVRFMLPSGEYETLVTSLPRKAFPSRVIAELYHRRWGIETSFRSLKYTVGLVNLHGKSDDFVVQELYAALTIFNFASRVTSATVIQKPPGKLYRANFKMAVFLCREFLRNPTQVGYTLMQTIPLHRTSAARTSGRAQAETERLCRIRLPCSRVTSEQEPKEAAPATARSFFEIS